MFIGKKGGQPTEGEVVHTRRQLTALLVFAPWTPAITAHGANTIHAERSEFLGLLGEQLPGASHIGEAYLLLGDEPVSRDGLWDLIFGFENSTFETRMGRVSEAITSDFRRLDTVIVQGVLMSRSEARLCALIHLGTDHAHRSA